MPIGICKIVTIVAKPGTNQGCTIQASCSLEICQDCCVRLKHQWTSWDAMLSYTHITRHTVDYTTRTGEYRSLGPDRTSD